MRVGTRSKGGAALLVGLLLLQILAGLFPPSQILDEATAPKHINGSLTDNGDGTWTVTYSIGMDTTLDSGNTTSTRDSLYRFEVGWTDGQGETRIGLLGLDLDSEGFPTNTTIENASLRLHLDVSSGPVDTQAWSVLRQDWMLGDATWISRNIIYFYLI